MFTEQTFNIPELTGISPTTIEEHLKLYAGYVKNANSIIEKLAVYQKDETKVYEMGELYRRFAFEYNGIRNHEVYFSLLENGAKDFTTGSPLHEKIIEQWASIDAFLDQFKAVAMTRGIGWAMLSWDKQTGVLIMHWVDEQHLGQLQGTTAIVALDMWEHSYVADYQPSGKKQYVEDFFTNLNWTAAEAHFAAAQGTN